LNTLLISLFVLLLSRSCSTGVYLSAVAVADLGVMYFELFRVWFEWIQLVPPEYYFNDVYCKLANYMNGVVRDYSNWLIACLTLERVVMMTSPYLARKFCTVRRAHRVVITLLTAICAPHVHTLIFSKAQKVFIWFFAAVISLISDLGVFSGDIRTTCFSISVPQYISVVSALIL